MDRRTAAALDRYLTREPPEPPEPVECSECGEEVPDEPIRKVEQVEYVRCDGKPKVLENQTHDEGVLSVIGQQHADDTFTVAYTAECGLKEGGEHGSYGEEVSPTLVEEYTHEPHWFTPPFGVLTTIYRRCPNGHEHREDVM